MGFFGAFGAIAPCVKLHAPRFAPDRSRWVMCLTRCYCHNFFSQTLFQSPAERELLAIVSIFKKRGAIWCFWCNLGSFLRLRRLRGAALLFLGFDSCTHPRTSKGDRILKINVCPDRLQLSLFSHSWYDTQIHVTFLTMVLLVLQHHV